MKIQGMIPTAPEVVREAIIVIAGAALAVAVVRLLPPLAEYLKPANPFDR